ncbi:TetR/AcrR family transcriptional regulator [Propionibacteriaceae bacterium G1746]|uniref:TetR/AcrR family transcriptional regulator n=1 Tax=Aestuariimicrobium sp. G57 TaxID=3418485 RepID=UPI003C27CA58
MKPEPRTAKGRQTRRNLLEAAEHVFAELGYQEASITRITERAGVGQGTFYLYFDSKLDLFSQLVDDLSSRVRRAMAEGAAPGASRIEVERAGFAGFFRFIVEHPGLYRIIREAEFAAPDAHRRHYTKLSDGYIAGLSRARAAGEVGDIDPTVAAWALMGAGELIGKRWVLWNGSPQPLSDDDLDAVVAFVASALGATTSANTRKEN